MTDLFFYLIKVSIVTGIFYLFYVFLFQRTSFHQLNRILLLFIMAFSIICPFLDFNFFGNYQLNTNYLWINELENSPYEEALQITGYQNESLIKTENFILLVYLLGVFGFFLRSVIQIWLILRLKQSAVMTLKEDFTVYVFLDKIKAPFSFFRWIFLPIGCKHISGDNSIIEHEKVHAKQLHSLDLVLSEAYCIIFWFNPFVFLLNKSLKSVHEFIADNQVIKSNKISVEKYLQLLVSKAEMNISYGVTSSFNSLTIKKRIDMITKNTTSKLKKFSYFILVPIVILMIHAFSTHNITTSPSPLSGKNNLYTRDISGNVPDIKPINEEKITKIASGYGMRKHPLTGEMKMHYGIDIVAETGTPVVATADGVVVEKEFIEEGKGYGRRILIQHNQTYSTHYTQLSSFNVEINQRVKRGDVVGYVGSSGISTGPHLHYEVWKNGERVNPQEYFD